jgi:PAS domain S-box-containing protein
MNLLDMRTVLFGYALSNFICALVVVLLWRQNRSRFMGLGFWAADFIMQFVGVALIFLRGIAPDFLSIVISNTLVIAGTLLLYIGLERFLGKTSLQIYNYILVAVFITIQTYFAILQPNLMVRNINIALGILVFCAESLWLVVRRAEAEIRTYTRKLGLAFGGLCLVSIVQIVANLIAPPGNNMLQSGIFQTLTIVAFQMGYIGLTFSLLLLVNRRLLAESFHEIYERKQAEKSLQKLSVRYGAILDTVPDIITEVDANKVYTWVNQAGREFFGDSVIGKEAVYFFEGEQDTYERVQPLFNGKSDVFYVESWQRRQDGEKRLLAWWCRSIVDANGKVSGALSTARDITENQLVEETIREAEEKYRNIFDSTLIGIFRTTPQGQYIMVNPAYASILGYDNPEAIMQVVQDIGTKLYLDPNERKRLLERLERQGEIKGYETRLMRKDGQPVDVRIDDSLVRGPDGQALYYQGTLLDISERKQAERELERSRSLLEATLDSTADGILVVDTQGKITQYNKKFADLWSIPEAILARRDDEQVLSFVLDQLSKPEDFIQKVRDLYTHPSAESFDELFFKDGRVYERYSLPQRLGEQIVGRVWSFRDVTARKQAEEALRQRVEELQRLMDTAPIAILMARDPKCRVITGNQAANRIYSAREGENISVSIAEHSIARRFFQNGQELLPEELPIQQAVAQGVEVQNAEVEVWMPGGKMITMLGAASPLFDAQNQVRGAVAAFMDITERKKAEEKLRSALDEKEILLREVHHRVKNNLQAIVYLIEMQADQISDEVSQQFLKELEEQARTMSLVYEQVYQSDNLARIGMASYLEKLAENVLIAFGRGRTIQLNLDIAPISLNVEKAMPCGLIVNELVTNSLKYAFPADCQDPPTIQINLRTDDESYGLCVGDNGIGLPPELDWRTSRSLGLRLVRLWATHQLGGEIELTSAPGTCFEIRFSTTG